jgi:hypothetical protein
MQRSLRPSALIPNGLIVGSAVLEGAAAVITVRLQAETSACPSCGVQARRVHSRYKRKLLDLPLGGRPVQLVVSARRSETARKAGYGVQADVDFGIEFSGRKIQRAPVSADRQKPARLPCGDAGASVAPTVRRSAVIMRRSHRSWVASQSTRVGGSLPSHPMCAGKCAKIVRPAPHHRKPLQVGGSLLSGCAFSNVRR